MPFMFLILAFLLWAVVWGFFHANPRGVDARGLLACNSAILVAGGSAFMIVVAAGGLLRNLALFPLSKRKGS